MNNTLKYGQWDVEFSHLKESEFKGETSYYITCDVTGNWIADHGIYHESSWMDIKFHNAPRRLMCYDSPELLPKGLKERINKKAEKIYKTLLKEKGIEVD